MQNNKPIFGFIGAIVLLVLIVWQSQGAADALDYRSSWGVALQEARDTGKPILINFGGPW